MSKVYAVQQPFKKDPATGNLVKKMNIDPAKKYGEIVFLLDWKDTRVLAPQPMAFKLRQKLRGYTSEDYLLMVGHPIAISLAAAIASDLNMGRLNLLYWDRAMGGYICVRSDIHNRAITEEQYERAGNY